MYICGAGAAQTDSRGGGGVIGSSWQAQSRLSCEAAKLPSVDSSATVNLFMQVLAAARFLFFKDEVSDMVASLTGFETRLAVLLLFLGTFLSHGTMPGIF